MAATESAEVGVDTTHLITCIPLFLCLLLSVFSPHKTAISRTPVMVHFTSIAYTTPCLKNLLNLRILKKNYWRSIHKAQGLCVCVCVW